ncbi:MAG: N-acetyl-gamma-glutamyl-phosphate reductase [Nitrospinae bacterium CG11_big_fil_rev_8_21_14_0_20_56_8]|nr:MAG: N-acetyl-gamma-glutamyl-phosphate reductase [Nitrospinae bacterium CG11_big_fil_rev_8_21_14_0_20_56_8]
MLKAGIAGATGYTGLELIRLLLRHPQVEIACVTSETYQGQSVAEVFPSLTGFCDLKTVPLDSLRAEDLDVLFLALPHTAAMDQVPRFLTSNCRVIDLSADYRLKNASVYAAWYAVPHKNPETLKEAVYGLPEIHRSAIQSAKLVANPGCYPTSVILALAPLLSSDRVDPDSIVADSKSGVSGAGRKTALHTQFCEANEGVSAYALGTHRHTPEIEQEVSALAGREIRISFSPHLMPMTRGILSTVYLNLTREATLEDVLGTYREFYKNEPFVRVLPEGRFANTRFVAGTNFCDIGAHVDPRTRRVVITSAIDNLVKGASGQAVQNMNLMLGINEKTGLDFPALVP